MPSRKPPKRDPSKNPRKRADDPFKAARAGLPVTPDGEYYADCYNAGDPYYGGFLTPLEFMLKYLQDGRNPVDKRLMVANMAAPYIHAKPSAKPYQPTEEEKRQLDESRRLIVEIVDYSEVEGD